MHPGPDGPPRSKAHLDPHRFDRVHDAYGPGSYLAWLLGVYVIGLYLMATAEHRTRRGYRALDKDLTMVLAFPIFVAGHLIYQVMHYSGDRARIWPTTINLQTADTPAEDLQAAMAIRAAAQVCQTALAVNTLLDQALTESKTRRRLLAVASAWEFGALIFASCHREWESVLFATIGGIVGHMFVVFVIPFVVGIPLYQFFETLSGSVRGALRELVALHIGGFIGYLLEALFKLIFLLLFAAIFWAFAFMLFATFLLPGSAHKVSELFQACAFTVGVVSVLFSGRDLWKIQTEEHGPGANMFYDEAGKLQLTFPWQMERENYQPVSQV